ncbi:MAG: cyclic nucleotide-binding domain-containing protein [Proteobacteria bacterium]|nr:cyclic nucleotide-binding domain-containing protein [Pseudomonadota bacterium]
MAKRSAVDIRGLKRRANDAMLKGRFQKALGFYGELARHQPNEPSWPKREAEIHRRLDQPREETEALERAADLYRRGGFLIQAIALCKRILVLAPDRSDIQDHLAEMALETGHPMDPPPEAPEHASPDTPLEEIVLTNVVETSAAPDLSESLMLGASEIQLGESSSLSDLTLDPEWSGDLDALMAPDPSSPAEAEAEEPLESDAALAVDSPSRAEEQLRATPLFGAMDAAALQHVIQNLRLVELDEGQVLFRQGDTANALYVVASGAVVPIAEGAERTKLAVLSEGEFFGEIGLVTNQPRNATVEALVPTQVLELDRQVMWSLVEREPRIFQVLLDFLRERLIDRLVRTSPLFGFFARTQRSVLASQFRFLEIQPGTHIVEQGQVASALFVLLAGQADVSSTPLGGGPEKHLASLKPGDVFGELSLLDGEAAMGTVKATTRCWALALPETRFREMSDRSPALADWVAALAGDRRQRNRETAATDLDEDLGWV